MTIERVLDALSSTRFCKRMTILLAAILGNLLAWCVHAFMWWLRLHKLKWVSTLGFVFGAPLSLITLFFASFTSWGLLTPLIVIFLVGFLQSRWIEEETAPVFFAVWSAFTEFALAVLVFFSAAIIPSFAAWPDRIAMIYALSFGITLFLLAIFRPLVVRYSQRMWNLIQEKKETA